MGRPEDTTGNHVVTSNHTRPRIERLALLYLQLAEAAANRRAMDTRNRLLLLAGRSAHIAGWANEADQCRELVLRNNPRHLIGKHSSFADALIATDYEAFDRQLQRICPQEKAEHLATVQNIETEVAQNEPPRLLAHDILSRLTTAPTES